jgi:hypothetical protein
MNAFSGIEIRNYDDVLAVLLARKNELGLTHELVEEITGITRGHFDKIFGPTRQKRMGWLVFSLMLPALGVKLRAEVDEPQAALMRARWEKRNEKQIRVRSPAFDKVLFELAKLEVFKEMAQRRALVLTASRRSAIARRAIRARWKKHRRSKR